MQKNLLKSLDRAAKIKDKSLRIIHIAAIINEALSHLALQPILVGGAAVEFYTQGAYTTIDLDFVCPHHPLLEKTMLNLGFQRQGKDYFDDKRKIYIEFPGSTLGVGEQINIIQLNKIKIRIISLEDLIIDRLCAFKFWNSEVDLVNAFLLLTSSNIDPIHIEKRAVTENVMDIYLKLEKFKNEPRLSQLTPQTFIKLFKS